MSNEFGFAYSCRTELGRPAVIVWVRFFVATRNEDGTPDDWDAECFGTRGPEGERIPVRIPVPSDVVSGEAMTRSLPPPIIPDPEAPDGK